jgi:hypothetical protein
MTKFIKDVFQVHNTVMIRGLGGMDSVDPTLFMKQFQWDELRAYDAIHIFRAIEPAALVPTFKAQCPECKSHTSVDEYVKEINLTGSYTINCGECATEFKVTVDNINPYFRINPLYAKSRKDIV